MDYTEIRTEKISTRELLQLLQALQCLAKCKDTFWIYNPCCKSFPFLYTVKLSSYYKLIFTQTKAILIIIKKISIVDVKGDMVNTGTKMSSC